MHALRAWLVALSLSATAVSQTVPELIDQLPSCSLSCFQSNVPNGCPISIAEVDLQCRCINRFEVQDALVDCVTAACTALDGLDARVKYRQICNRLETSAAAGSSSLLSASLASTTLPNTATSSRSVSISEALAEATTGGGPSLESEAGDSASSDGNGSSTPIGAIAGGVVGGVLALAIIAVLGFLLLRSRRKAKAVAAWKGGEKDSEETVDQDRSGMVVQESGRQIDAEEERSRYGFRDEKTSYMTAVNATGPPAGPDDVGSSMQNRDGTVGHELDSTERYELSATR